MCECTCSCVCVRMRVLAEKNLCLWLLLLCVLPPCLHIHVCTHMHTDVFSSANVDTGPGSNLCVFSPVLSPTRPECSFIHLFLHSKTIFGGLTWYLALLSALSSEPEDLFSPGPLNGHTASRMRPTLHVHVSPWGRFTVPGKAKWVGEGPRRGFTSHGAKRHCGEMPAYHLSRR